MTALNGVKVYTVSGHRQFASWLPPDKKRALRKDQGKYNLLYAKGCFQLLCALSISRRMQLDLGVHNGSALSCCLDDAVVFLFMLMFYRGLFVLMLVRTDYLRRIDLIQDLEFDTAATRMKATPDGQYIVASGELISVLNFINHHHWFKIFTIIIEPRSTF